MAVKRLSNKVLLNNCMSWIYEHCYDGSDYVRALNWCGFTLEQVLDELDDCGFSPEEDLEIAQLLKRWN